VINEYLKDNPQWIEDCNRFLGGVLQGRFSHWCWEWDGLPVDETCILEFDCCDCWKGTEYEEEFLLAKQKNRPQIEKFREEWYKRRAKIKLD
jgi:hypothetical protein